MRADRRWWRQCELGCSDSLVLDQFSRRIDYDLTRNRFGPRPPVTFGALATYYGCSVSRATQAACNLTRWWCRDWQDRRIGADPSDWILEAKT
jgi:hypothetical protein